jgi:c-di-AMP phosphodiesterase-like protein
MIIIALSIVVMFVYGHFAAGFSALAVYGFLTIYNIQRSKVKKDEWKKFIEEFSSNLDIATRGTLLKLPFPLIIVGEKGRVMWYNQNASTMLEEEDILGKDIGEVVKDFNKKKVLSEKVNQFNRVNIKSKYYDIYTSIINTSENKGKEESIVLLYFNDVTEHVLLQKSINDTKEAVMLIEVDNLDEVIKSTEEDKKPLLIAEIERALNNYGQGLNSVFKKYSSNKYILVTQDRYIQSETEKKFDILDIVREINQSNKLAVTLSVGIGRSGKTPLENYNFAISAKELALGRGGDQVVVKNAEKLSFYGGKTKEVEKRKEAKARVIAHALVDLINGSSGVFIMGHNNPDTDCFGAAIGINSVVRLLNKPCSIILNGKV